jgi:hypothetical protein
MNRYEDLWNVDVWGKCSVKTTPKPVFRTGVKRSLRSSGARFSGTAGSFSLLTAASLNSIIRLLPPVLSCNRCRRHVNSEVKPKNPVSAPRTLPTYRPPTHCLWPVSLLAPRRPAGVFRPEPVPQPVATIHACGSRHPQQSGSRCIRSHPPHGERVRAVDHFADLFYLIQMAASSARPQRSGDGQVSYTPPECASF